MTVEVFTKSGTRAATQIKLNKAIFGLRIDNHQLLKEVYLAYLANKRANLAKTKRRGEVSGGGAKPWRQKGTGRARAGSIRSPLWRGGGVSFGPSGNVNYQRKINTNAKRLALKQALSLAASEGRIKIIDSFNFADGRVKSALSLLNKIGAAGNTLLVTDQKDQMIQRATNNLPTVKVILANYLTVYDVINADTIVIAKKALEQIEDWLGRSTTLRRRSQNG
jgi:large subunit ribosomal protein L4